MDKIIVEGGRRLVGEVEASGAKNSALPLIFAALLTDEPCRLRGVPDVADIRTAAALLASLGAEVEFPAKGEISINCSTVDRTEADYDLVRKPDQPTRFEGRATNLNVRSVDVPAFRAFLETEGQALLERADEWLSRHEPSQDTRRKYKTTRMGVGIYQIQDDEH